MKRLIKITNTKFSTILDPTQELFRWRVAAYPAFLTTFCYGMTNTQGWPKSELIFLEGDCYWWSNWKDIDEQGRQILVKWASRRSGDFKTAYYHWYHQAFKDLDEEFVSINHLQLATLSESEFRRIWFRFFQIFYDFSRALIIPEVLAYYTSRELERRLMFKSYSLASEEISRLTIFPECSFLMTEEHELLKIGEEPNRRKRDYLLAAHAKKYAWLLSGYHGVRKLADDFFARRLKEFGNSAARRRQADRFRSYSAIQRRDFKNLIKKYRLDLTTVNLAKLAQRGSYLQDNRKCKQLETISYIDRLYRELARRLNLSPQLIRYMNYFEFDQIIVDRSARRKLAKRQQGCRLTLAYSRPVFSTNQVRPFQKFLEEIYVGGQSAEIRGIVVQPGKVSGPVKIIWSAKDIMNFPPGRILVAQMTSPDYIVAIKKAKAIVTDDGGLTCHAAIVARELGLPCIVGTKNATSRLKDGDWVEVNADDGLVRKIKP